MQNAPIDLPRARNHGPCTPLNATRVGESVSSVVFATQNATVHHCIVDLLPMKVVVSCHALQTSMDTWLMYGASVQRRSYTLGAQKCYRGTLGYLQCTGYCFEGQR